MLIHRVVPSMKEMLYQSSTQKTGADVFTSLLTFALLVWPEIFPAPDLPLDPHYRPAFPQSIELIFVDFTKCFDVVTSDL